MTLAVPKTRMTDYDRMKSIWQEAVVHGRGRPSDREFVWEGKTKFWN